MTGWMMFPWRFGSVTRATAASWHQEDWLKFAAYAVFAVVFMVVLTTFRDYGIGWDSRVQATYGEKLLSFYLSGFADRSAFTYADLRYYGGFFDIAAALLNHISPFGEYPTRHLLSAVFFIVGLVGAWRLTHLLAGARAALIAVVALATTPLLYGHAFMNPKDTPFAWLLVWVTYFACRILQDRGRTSMPTYVGFAITLGLALGTRVFAFAYLAYLLAALVLIRIASDDATTRTGCDRSITRLAWYMPAACAVMLAFWPWAALGPANFLNSVDTFLHFPHRVPVLWDGEVFPSTKPPPSYLLVLLAVQIPEYLLIGLVLAATRAFVTLRQRGFVASAVAQPAYPFLLATALVPLAAFTVLRPTVYNGLRQFLFIVPPLIIVAAIGWDWAFSFWQRRSLVIATSVLFAIGAATQVLLMTNVHPYEYVVFNSLAGGLRGAAGRYELDYWGVSLAEASRDLGLLKESGKAIAGPHRVFVCGDRASAEGFLPPGFQIAGSPEEADFIVAPAEPPCRNLTKRPMRIIAEVKRSGVVLSRVYDLRPAPDVRRQAGTPQTSGQPKG